MKLQINPKVLKHFYKVISLKGKALTLKSLYNEAIITLNVDPRKDFSKKKYILLNENREFLTKRQELALSRNYKIQDYFLRKLGAEKYKKLIENTPELISPYLQMDPAGLECIELDSELKKSFLDLIVEYKRAQKEKSDQRFTFYYVSKEQKGFLVLKNIVEAYSVNKQNNKYTIFRCNRSLEDWNLIKTKILEQLESTKKLKYTQYLIEK